MGEDKMFWFLDKETNTPDIFGSVSAICAKTELKKDGLYYHFSRLKRTEFENEKYRIVKCKVNRALRSQNGAQRPAVCEVLPQESKQTTSLIWLVAAFYKLLVTASYFKKHEVRI